MKIKFVNSVSYILILSLVGMFTFTSCESDPEAMDLPPVESLVIDLDAFPSNSKKAADVISINWPYSFASILIWNTALAVNIAIPVAAYSEAFNHTPVYLGDNSWEWKYSVPVNAKTYVASLVGTRINNETFTMEMTLSEEGGFQNFAWFDGVIKTDLTEATWTLSHSPLFPTDYLEITFSRDIDTDIYTTKYEVIDPQNDLYQGYIEYGYMADSTFDAHYNIHRADTTTFIEWSVANHNGRVKDARFFKDDLWHCWDTQLKDVDCPVD